MDISYRAPKFAHPFSRHTVIILTSLTDLRAALADHRTAGRRVGLVPTMGFLHAGHMSLVEYARAHSDVVVMTIFVNPTQFAPTEDLAKYPRDIPRDTAMAEKAGVDILFVPAVDEIYPAGFDTFVMPGAQGSILEGAIRPTHFRGVLTVVAKLFNMILPDVAVFGQKDFQQALLLRKMARDLNFAVDVLIAPIVREADGLAMSSRNVYLSPDERAQARVLSASLAEALHRIADGERSAAQLEQAIRTHIMSAPAAAIDYIAIAAADTLAPVEQLEPGRTAVIALAVRIGKTRLLDNILVENL